MTTLSLFVNAEDLKTLDKIANQIRKDYAWRKLTRDPDATGQVTHADPAADKKCGGANRAAGRTYEARGFESGEVFVPYWPYCYFCNEPVIWAGWLRAEVAS